MRDALRGRFRVTFQNFHGIMRHGMGWDGMRFCFYPVAVGWSRLRKIDGRTDSFICLGSSFAACLRYRNSREEYIMMSKCLSQLRERSSNRSSLFYKPEPCKEQNN